MGVGLASTFVPGLGQVINNDWGKGVTFFAGNIALQSLYLLALLRGGMPSPLAGLGGLGLGIWSIVDAVKNSRTEIKQIILKEQARLDVQA